jgi:asparagine synthase (glutamine-hydrolysing)
MSAIFGLLARNGAPIEKTQLASIDAALARHGSDASGTWTEGPVALGHRLTCFTPEDRFERQPLCAPDDDVALIVDGRIDNRAELGRSLDIGAAQARALPDSAFVLRAYAHWGERFLEHLVGEFSLALWDGRRRSLLLGCSAPVARPLYYHNSPQLFAFASRPSGLFALPHVERHIDEERIAGFLAMVNVGRDRTFYRELRQLRPGQMLAVSDAGHRVTEWWRPNHIEEIRLRSDRDYVAAFDDLLQRVIGEHLRAEAPVGISVSGGLDSGSVAAVSAGLLERDQRLAAYTEVPPAGFDQPVTRGHYADETPFVRALAAMHPNIDLELIKPGGQGLLANVDRFLAAAEVPLRNVSNRGWIEAIYERARHDGVRVLLTGDYGNVTASYDGAGLLPQLLRQRRVRRALQEARAGSLTGGTSATSRAIVGQGVMPLLPTSFSGVIDRLRNPRPRDPGTPWERYSLIHPEFAIEHGLAGRIDRRRERLIRYPGSDPRAARLFGLAPAALGADVITGYRSLFGVDTRAPLADRRLVEFCLGLPEDQYARAGETRWLIRRAMADRLPPQVLSNRQRGLQAADWAQQIERERDRLLTEVSGFSQDEFVSHVLDLPRLRGLLEGWPRAVGTDPTTISLYRGGVATALMTARFLTWFRAGPRPGAE